MTLNKPGTGSERDTPPNQLYVNPANSMVILYIIQYLCLIKMAEHMQATFSSRFSW